MLLLVFAAAGLAGVLYWRQSVRTPRAPVAASAGEPAKEGKTRRRRRHGVRRLARNEAFVASAPSGEAPVGEGTTGHVRGLGPPRPPPEDRAPLAPGGSSTTEAPPSEVFGAPSSPAPAPTGVQRQPVAEQEPEPIKLRTADLKIIWQGEDSVAARRRDPRLLEGRRRT